MRLFRLLTGKVIDLDDDSDDPSAGLLDSSTKDTPFRFLPGSEERVMDSRETEWRLVLGVDSSADLTDCHVAYREQISQYHPDKVARLAIEFRTLADTKSKELNAAWVLAKKTLAAKTLPRTATPQDDD